MKANEIKVGGVYIAKVSNKLTRVRVDSISDRPGYDYCRDRTVYHVTNLATGRQTTFRSAAKFRKEIPDYPGTEPENGDRRCVHGNTWGGKCPYCDGYNRPATEIGNASR